MKKFKFSLEGLRRIRELDEQQCKTKIGLLQIEITKIQDRINYHDQSITEYYQSMERVSEDDSIGRELQVYPYLVNANSCKIQELEQQLKDKLELLSEYNEELAQKRANLKLINNMKDDKIKAHKKAIEKKEASELDEIINNWLQYNKRSV